MLLLHYTSSAAKHITNCPGMRENYNETDHFARICQLNKSPAGGTFVGAKGLEPLTFSV